jgi:hypothetical protein
MGKGNKFKTEIEAPKLDPEYQGAKSYRLTEKHYRDGRLFEAGAKVTVTNEEPGTTWEPIAFDPALENITRLAEPDKFIPADGTPAIVPALGLNAPSTRASDRAI